MFGADGFPVFLRTGFLEDRISMVQKIVIIDDDEGICDFMCSLLESAGYSVKAYASAEYFLAHYDPRTACLIVDIRMPDMGGLELQEELVRRNISLPVIIITGYGDVPLAIRALKAGVIDFIEKPFSNKAILDSIMRALESGRQTCTQAAQVKAAKDTLALLTPREQSVLQLLVNGNSNKISAHELGISPRTLEVHRAHIMNKMDARNLSDVVRIALAAGGIFAGGT
jgi:two-component system response regulator FixJ